MTQENILSFGKFRYLKLALMLIVGCMVAYLADSPPIKPSGGTWLGYTLGTIGMVLILWLLAFGMRKRAYRSNLGSVRGWLSAHVYLGFSLSVVATLHTGFSFGWNVHTLAYVLTITVIVSGMWGVVLYLRLPTQMGNLLNGRTLQQYGQMLCDIDDECRKLAEMLSPALQAQVASSAQALIFASHWQRFSGKNARCATLKVVADLEKQVEVKQPGVQEVYTLQFRRLQQLKRIREFVRLRSWTEVWLVFHVPLSFALLGSLVAHIVSVFFYW